MSVFDPNTIKDEAIRDRYLRVLKRGETIAATMLASFGSNRAPIHTRFVDEPTFNAYASRNDEGYLLELSRPVPLLLLVLFERLLVDQRLFPWLDTAGQIVTEYDIEFVIDPANFAQRENWKINLTDDRAFVAGILSEITTAFIQMHELGHVLSGHIETHHQLTGQWSVAELVQHSAANRRHWERERAWEADADGIAAGFLVRYLSELVQQTCRSGPAAHAFGRGNHTVENVLSIAVVALFAMFAYVRGTRYRLGKQSSHPHPLVRSFYVKDTLFTAGGQEWKVDFDVLAELTDLRLDEMLTALEAIRLFKGHLINDRYLAKVEASVARIATVREKHRRICAPWAWISWVSVNNS